MTDTMKNFYEYASKNEQIVNELKNLGVQGKDEKTAMDDIIALAKKHGFTLTQEDFASAKQKLSDEELNNVAGGSNSCSCFVAGTGRVDGNNCVCVAGGGGAGGGSTFCVCICYGEGEH